MIIFFPQKLSEKLSNLHEKAGLRPKAEQLRPSKIISPVANTVIPVLGGGLYASCGCQKMNIHDRGTQGTSGEVPAQQRLFLIHFIQKENEEISNTPSTPPATKKEVDLLANPEP